MLNWFVAAEFVAAVLLATRRGLEGGSPGMPRLRQIRRGLRRRRGGAGRRVVRLDEGTETGLYRTDGTRILGPDGRPVVLRGMGLGGWLMPEGYMRHVPGRASPTTIRARAVAAAGEEGAAEYFALYRGSCVREADIASALRLVARRGGFNLGHLTFTHTPSPDG